MDGTDSTEQFPVAKTQCVPWSTFLHSQAEIPVQNHQISFAPGLPPLTTQLKLIPGVVVEKLNWGKIIWNSVEIKWRIY